MPRETAIVSKAIDGDLQPSGAKKRHSFRDLEGKPWRGLERGKDGRGCVEQIALPVRVA